MSFRLVSSGGAVTDPAVVNMYASGVIRNGTVVDFIRGATGSQGFVSPASSASTTTTIFGVATGYVQGKSDTQVGVIPFSSGQVWEADCTSNATTLMVGLKHGLTDFATLANTSYSLSTAVGVFLAWNVVGAAAEKKMIGEFLRNPTAIMTVTSSLDVAGSSQ